MQEGVVGWRVAHERAVWEGWAEEVIGARAESEVGRVFWLRGKRIGDMNGLISLVSIGRDLFDSERHTAN